MSPSGDIDLATVRTLRARIDELTEAGFEHLVLDLRGATFLDSTGLHLMIELDESARAHGWRFSIVEGPAEVQRAFEITGLRATLPFLDAGEVPIRH